MQDYQLYSFTLIDNLTFSENITDNEIKYAKKCIHDIGLDNVIDNAPDGFQSYLTQRYNENGIELSGGEHQKLAIARVLYKNAPIMILDEPTSSISPQSEYEIYQNFSHFTGDKTVLYISHRMSSCTLCDRIIVFDNGKIIEDGSHEQLLGTKGLYTQMFEKQASLYNL